MPIKIFIFGKVAWINSISNISHFSKIDTSIKAISQYRNAIGHNFFVKCLILKLLLNYGQNMNNIKYLF